MRVLGIIAEYNPFHNGHFYHLTRSVELVKPDYVIAVISGHFTQRGEASIIDKWARTAMALKNGIDLVLEIPTVYACQTAELFAWCGIQLLNHTGLVTHVSFGSEIDELQLIKEISNVLKQEPPEYKNMLKQYLADGVSFPRARYRAIKSYLNATAPHLLSKHNISKTVSSSNSILAIEYLKALDTSNSTIEPVVIARKGSSYNCPNIKTDVFSSATAIRNEILVNGCSTRVFKAMPESSFHIMKKAIAKGRGPVTNKSLEQLILGMLRCTPTNKIKKWMDVTEGLENRIKSCGLSASTLDDFLNKVKTKRYVHTRLQRILVHGLLGITNSRIKIFNSLGGPQYLRILGFRKEATALLTQLKRTSRVPVISKAADYYKFKNPALKNMFEIDVLATNLYVLGFPGKEHRKGGQEFTQRIVIL